MFTLDGKQDKIRFSKEVPEEVTVIGYENGFIKFDLNEAKDNSARDFIFYNFLFAIPEDPIGTSVTQELPTDLEVVYVGQAFGRNADKTIDYRLVSHEKVQKIAIEILNKGSNEEILVLGIDVDANDITTGFSLSASPTEFTKEKFYELMSNAKQRVPEGQKITIFEASLIKYFKPDLNKEYKETFPSQDFASYKEIYQTKFNYISFTIDCYPGKARLYSRSSPDRKYVHHNVHSLATNEEKKSLFDYLMTTEGAK